MVLQSDTSQSEPHAEALEKALELRRDGNLVEASNIYRDILKADFGNLDAWLGLGLTGYDHENHDFARDTFWRLLQVASSRADIWTAYGRVLGRQKKTEQCEEALRKAISLNPYYAPAHLELGICFFLKGLKSEGVECLNKAIALAPNQAGPYLQLAGEGQIKFGDQRFQELLKMASEARDFKSGKHEIHFSLAKVYEKTGDYGSAFRHYEIANSHSEEPESSWQKRIARRFNLFKIMVTPEFLSWRVPEIHKIYTPIFIVGMPRSGTTLTDQIFGTHSQVYAGDELAYLNKYAQRMTLERTHRHFPEAAGSLQNEDYIAIAKLYQLRVRELNSTQQFITDKMPWNFQMIGVIYKAMPWAKVIHIHRNPVDCGFSNFRAPLSRDIQYSCTFEGFAYYRKHYQDLMDFWRATIPDFYLDLCYEELVEHPEREIRRVLDFCGLPWEDKLLSFHTTQREVRTISRNQVNKPLNRESIGYDQKYGELLDPLKDALRRYGLIEDGRPVKASESARP